MITRRMPLYVIGGIIVIVLAAAITYAVMKGKSQQTMDAPMKDGTTMEMGGLADAARTDKVTISNYSFGQSAIAVKAGTKVTWTDQDSVNHTVTSADGAQDKFDSGLFGKGESFSFTFNKSGTYSYYCQAHPFMKGTVFVTE